MELAIETVGLSKRFAALRGYRDLLRFKKRTYVEALRSVDLQVPQGAIFGLLGPNGAGKTTLFKILGTLILQTSGEARVLGIDVARNPSLAKRHLTYVISEERSLFWRLTGKQNLDYFAVLFGLSSRDTRRRVADLLGLLDLDSVADRRVMYYSTGMRQRLSLARGLLGDPEILLLDEPTRSLDPLVAQSLWDFFSREIIGRQGKTILVATHNLEEARRECQTVAVLHKGEIRASGSIKELTRYLTPTVRYSMKFRTTGNGVVDLLSTVPGVHDVSVDTSRSDEPHNAEFLVDDPEVGIPQVLERVAAAGGRILTCAPLERSLGDVLAELTGG